MIDEVFEFSFVGVAVEFIEGHVPLWAAEMVGIEEGGGAAALLVNRDLVYRFGIWRRYDGRTLRWRSAASYYGAECECHENFSHE